MKNGGKYIHICNIMDEMKGDFYFKSFEGLFQWVGVSVLRIFKNSQSFLGRETGEIENVNLIINC